MVHEVEGRVKAIISQAVECRDEKGKGKGNRPEWDPRSARYSDHDDRQGEAPQSRRRGGSPDCWKHDMFEEVQNEGKDGKKDDGEERQQKSVKDTKRDDDQSDEEPADEKPKNSDKKEDKDEDDASDSGDD
ncbi:hypothetical protein AK812_SmicGene1257 [Symbiodinium microadriaticum]|uniref:Uncharacterized protein n=2 Tax=Symbiodinium TaxID=2949 RepID=A0A1Q9F4H2_SYMMI|nr:hypothetical protein AK812_SmicGene1257 [Symbiodinium microadriaticum]